MDQKIYNELQDIKKLLRDTVTKDDLKQELANHPTKDDLKRELAKHPTKNDLEDALDKQAEDFGEIVNALFTSSDKRKADRTEVDQLNKRVTRIERKFAA